MSKHKFNVLDAVIIIVVIAALAAGGFIFLRFNNPTLISGRIQSIEFDVEVTDLTYDVANSFKPGAPVIFGTTNSDSGEITNVKVEPYKKIMQDKLNGAYLYEQYADKYQATVTIKTMVSETDEGFVGTKEQIMIGSSMPFRGKGFASPQGFITDLRIAD